MFKYFLILLALLVNFNSTKGQAFSIDTSFHLEYNFYAPPNSPNVYGIILEPDNKMTIYGDFYDIGRSPYIARFFLLGNLTILFITMMW